MLEIYARESFGSAEGVNEAVDSGKARRNVRQFGRKLPPKERTNRGVVPANIYDLDNGQGFLLPTVRVPESGYQTTIAGIHRDNRSICRFHPPNEQGV